MTLSYFKSNRIKMAVSSRMSLTQAKAVRPAARAVVPVSGRRSLRVVAKAQQAEKVRPSATNILIHGMLMPSRQAMHNRCAAANLSGRAWSVTSLREDAGQGGCQCMCSGSFSNCLCGVGEEGPFQGLVSQSLPHS